MISRLLHPGDRALGQFADDPQASDAIGVRRHLAECQRCRDHVAFLRSIAEQAAGLDGRSAGDDLLRRIQARAAVGEQVILPTADNRARRPRVVPWLSAAAAALIVAAVWSTWPARVLTAGATTGDLQFTPGSLEHGPIAIRFRDGGLFPDARQLAVRARYRGASGEPYNYASRQWRVATLVRQRNGEFTGTLTIPDSIVYAAFAVESEDGTRVDDHGHRLWYLMTGEGGKPTFKALEQRAQDLMGENMELAMHVLQERVRLYPDHPAGWGSALALERFMLGQAHADSGIAEHCARLARLDSLYRRKPHVTPDEAEGLVGYSVQIDEKQCVPAIAIAKYWLQWLYRDASRAPESIVRQYSVRVDSVWKAPSSAAALAEEYWPASGELGMLLLNNGLYFADATKDSAAILRWLDRNTLHTPVYAAGILKRFVEEPLVRPDVLNRLRSTARAFQSPRDPLRPLERSTTAQAREDSASLRFVLAMIGEALIQDGKTRAGLDTLDIATRNGWDAALFRRVTAVRLGLGDTSGAVALVARLSVDPTVIGAEADSLRRLVQHFVAPDAWNSQLAQASEYMRETLLADATTIKLGRTLRMVRDDSVVTDLTSVSGGQVAVIVFWSRNCGPSRAQFPLLATLERQLDEHGMRLIAVTEESPSAETRAYMKEAKIAFPVYHDTWGEVGRAFQSFGTPQYFVTDGLGRIRFRYTTMQRALAQAYVLQGSERISQR